MLNGVDPIIIFNFKKQVPNPVASQASIPLTAEILALITLPAIPIYLSERLTGVYIDSENKSMEIDTSTETLTDGSNPQLNQRGITNTVKIEMVANADSVGISLFSALADLIFPRVTSKEYSITYLHGAVTVFSGLLHSFSITQQANTNLYNITLELIKPSSLLKLPIPIVPHVSGVAAVLGPPA